jgi:putative phage-type endonuclease
MAALTKGFPKSIVEPCRGRSAGNDQRFPSMPRAYEIIPLIERTNAWWEWRQGGVGSSDAPSILGEKQAKSVERLLLEKQQPPKESGRSFVRERGVALERMARSQYCLAIGVTVEPTCVQSLARPWQRASLDGLSANGERVVEIKCGLATYQAAAAKGRPPRRHYAQLQHILAVTGLPVIDYWCYVPSRPTLRLEVRRDEPYLERLLAAEEAFRQRFAK